MSRPESLKDWGAFLSGLLLFALFGFWVIDVVNKPPSEDLLRPVSGVLLKEPHVYRPGRARARLVMQLDSTTAVVQDFDFLPNEATAAALLGLQKGTQLTIYKRWDKNHLGGPSDAWAVQADQVRLLSLREAIAAKDNAARWSYKVLATLIGASVIAWLVGISRHQQARRTA